MVSHQGNSQMVRHWGKSQMVRHRGKCQMVRHRGRVRWSGIRARVRWSGRDSQRKGGRTNLTSLLASKCWGRAQCFLRPTFNQRGTRSELLTTDQPLAFDIPLLVNWRRPVYRNKVTNFSTIVRNLYIYVFKYKILNMNSNKMKNRSLSRKLCLLQLGWAACPWTCNNNIDWMFERLIKGE